MQLQQHCAHCTVQQESFHTSTIITLHATGSLRIQKLILRKHNHALGTCFVQACTCPACYCYESKPAHKAGGHPRATPDRLNKLDKVVLCLAHHRHASSETCCQHVSLGLLTCTQARLSELAATPQRPQPVSEAAYRRGGAYTLLVCGWASKLTSSASHRRSA